MEKGSGNKSVVVYPHLHRVYAASVSNKAQRSSEPKPSESILQKITKLAKAGLKPFSGMHPQ